MLHWVLSLQRLSLRSCGSRRRRKEQAGNISDTAESKAVRGAQSPAQAPAPLSPPLQSQTSQVLSRHAGFPSLPSAAHSPQRAVAGVATGLHATRARGQLSDLRFPDKSAVSLVS